MRLFPRIPLKFYGRTALCFLAIASALSGLLYVRSSQASADRDALALSSMAPTLTRADVALTPVVSTYTWTPTVTTDWSVATNWTPNRLTPATTDNLIFDGTGTPSPTVTNVPTQTIATITFTNGVLATFNAASGGSTLTIAGATGSDLSISSNSQLTLAGSNPLSISLASGSKGAVTGLVLLTDGGHRLSAADANGITFQSTSTFTAGSGFTGNPFGTVTNGSVVFQSGSNAFFNAGGDPFGGSGHSVATFNLGSSQTFFNAASFSYGGRVYGNLTLDGGQTYSGGAETGLLTIFNTLWIKSGSTLTLSSTASADLNLLADITINGTLNTNGRTVKFQGSSVTQNINTTATFGDVSISKTGGTVKLGGTLTVSGALQFDGTGSAVDVLEFNQNTLNLNGTVGGTSSSGSNGFKGDATGATLNVGGTGALGTLKFVSGAQSLKALSVNRTSSGTVTLGTNLTIGNASVGALTLTNGIIDVGSNTLSLASFPTITRTNGYVIGNLQKSFASNSTFTFTVGTANGYSPVDANLTGVTGNSLTVKAVQAKQPNIYTSNALQRYWTVSNSTNATADLTFHYLATDVVGTEANYKVLRYAGGFAQFSSGPINTGDPANHFVTANAVALNGGPYPSFDWTLADPTLTVNTTADTNDGACTALGTGNGCTLREAINAADSSGDPNPIIFNFDPSDAGCVSGVCTITLTSALPDLSTSMTITGSGANSLVVKRSTDAGTPNFRIFTVGSGVTASISGLTVTNGHTSDGTVAPSGSLLLQGLGGGGISNAGTLTLTSVVVTGNSTGNGAATTPSTISFAGQGGNGGGVFNSGTLTMTDVTVDGNTTGNGGLGGTGSSQYGGPGGDGAGIYSSGPLTLTRVTVSNNTAGNGNTGGTGGSGGSGGGVAHSALLTMTDCVVSGNISGQGAVGSNPGASSASSGSGGGVLGVFFPTGTLIMKNSTITGNRTADGPSAGSGGSGGTGAGVVINYNASGKIINSTISNNRTGDGLAPIAQGGFGGGVYNGGTLEIIGSTISGNQTGASSDGGGSLGGGIENDSALTVTNSTISGNRTGGIGGYGGGIVNNRTMTLNNVTITNNTSFANVGHGISQFSFLATPPNIRNSIIAGNGTGLPGSDINGDCTSGGYNLIGNADNSTGFNAAGDQKGTSSAPLNALLAALANNGGPTQTHALLPGSPAINAGSNSNLPADTFDLNGNSNTTEAVPFDQRGTGFNRIANGTVDIGAFESRGFTIVATSGTPQSAYINTAFSSPLVATVSSVFGEPVSGGLVTFTAPAGGPSGTFAGGLLTTNVTTNSSGVATSPSVTANTIAGSYYVSAATTGAPFVASFALTNAPAATSTGMSSSLNPSAVGQSVIFTANVTANAGSPTGTVLFKDGANSVGSAFCFASTSNNCAAQLSLSSLTAGLHVITATYSDPNGNYQSSSGTLSGGQLVGSLVSFESANYTVNESDGSLTIKVNRTGGVTGTVAVTYATNDAGASIDCAALTSLASSRCDFTTASGTLVFNSGETQKIITVLVNRDSYAEGPEAFTVALSNLTGAATFSTPTTTTVTIVDSAPIGSNTIDDSSNFVRQHYHDFLNREPDASGLQFWTNEIESCGTDANCREVKRINVSGAFFLSIEFQQTGYLVERLYKTAYGDATGNSTFGSNHTIPVPIVRLDEFLGDTQKIGQGIVVGQDNWQQQLENNKAAFVAEFVQRARFVNTYTGMDAFHFVDALNSNAGNPLSDSERTTLRVALAANGITRAQVLRQIAEHPNLVKGEFNRAFVLMQYFGYLRRNPNDIPENTRDYTGYDFWLNKLNQFGGNFQNAEMVRAFISSDEYRHRFGP